MDWRQQKRSGKVAIVAALTMPRLYITGVHDVPPRHAMVGKDTTAQVGHRDLAIRTGREVVPQTGAPPQVRRRQ